MGSERKWIYLAYLGITVALAWVLNNVLLMVAAIVRVRNPMILDVVPASALLSMAVMILAALIYFRQPKVDKFSNEVVQEVKKVTWPPSKATYLSTVVVVICVLVMAVILGLYDWICTRAVGWVLGI